MLKFIKTTIIGGVLFLLPIAATTVTLVKAVEMAVDAAAPVADKLPLPKIASIVELYIPAILAFLLISSVAGYLLQRMPYQRKIVPHLADKLLRKFPRYAVAKRYANLLAGIEIDDGMKPALIQVGRRVQLGFVVERLVMSRQSFECASATFPVALKQMQSVYFLVAGAKNALQP